MKVKELIDYLEKCNPEAFIYLGKPLDDYAEQANYVGEIGCSNLVIPTVYVY